MFLSVEKYEQVKITDFGLAKMLEYGHDEYEVIGGKVGIEFSSFSMIFKVEVCANFKRVLKFGQQMGITLSGILYLQNRVCMSSAIWH